jgi:hypothetical protein
MHRRGKWIWRDRGIPFPSSTFFANTDPTLDANLFVQFRRSVHLDAVPRVAPLRISADGRYRLYVNRTFVGRGPARCDPQFQYYDEHDIAPHLRAGENAVAVLVHSYGMDTSWYELPRTDWSRAFGCGGLFVECDAIRELDTSAAWRYLVSEAWKRDSQPGRVGFVELLDGRRLDDAWTDPGFDDSAWSTAIELTIPGIGIAPDTEPFPYMVARDIPPLFEEPRDAVAVASITEVATKDVADLIARADAPGEPLTSCSVERPDAMLQESGSTIVNAAHGRAVSIVLDFGRVVTGHPRIELEGPAGAVVDLSYAERLRDDGRLPVQRANPITSQSVHRYILRDGAQCWEKFDRAGFRYMQLTVSTSPDHPQIPVRIGRANITFTSYPVGDRGDFACSDDLLTKLWHAGRYTMQVGMQDAFEDCPSREQRQWVGDAYVESLVNYTCFGDPRLVAKLIRQVAHSQRRDGMTQMATPGDLAATNGLYIVDYCLSWIMTIGEYVSHTGDASILDDVFPNVVRAVAWFERHVASNGLLTEPPGWIFIDWAEVDRRGACTTLNALLVAALRHAVSIAERQGAARLASRWSALAGRIATAANDLLWDASRGIYVDALLVDGSQSPRVSQHANAAMIAASIAPPDRWDSALDYIMDPQHLVTTSTSFVRTPTPIDEEQQVVLAQPFFSHFLHRALAVAGRQQAIVDNIRDRWGSMLDASGFGTFWEHWHGNESRSHAWSATPVYDLSREVLGVFPTSPGYVTFRVQPHPCGLDWARGRYPTPLGDIAVAWRRSGSSIEIDLGVPDGAAAEVVLPACPPRQYGPGHHSMASVPA